MLGTVIMQKYYLVFDATPFDNFGLNYLRIGIGLEDHDKESKIGKEVFEEQTKFFEEYILYIYAAIFVLVLVVVIFLMCICVNCYKTKKLQRMSKTVLAMEADKMMKEYKADMDRKNEKDRKKAIERWRKKNPHKPIEDFTSSQMNDSLISGNTSFDYSSSKNTLFGGRKSTDIFQFGRLNDSEVN